jgi:hypothetical protein
MDRLYTMDGGWQRYSSAYVKDVVVHSTLFRSAITDRITLDSYRYFAAEYWDFAVDLSDTNILSLDYRGIELLIALAQEEVRTKSETIFGGDGSRGEFGHWAGDPPSGSSPGSGEYGRLLGAFNHWEGKQSQGIALMNAPFWDKPLWDSRGSWFSAPSMRSAIDIINSVAATIVGAVLAPFTAGGSFALALAINLTDDLFFNSLDVACGYKTWDEAGFAFGQKALISAAGSAAGAVFNGIGTAASGGFQYAGLTAKAVGSTSSSFGGVLAKTAMSGVQSFSTSALTSALGAVTYTNGSLGWSGDAFKAGIKSGLIGAAVSGTSTFTTGALNLGLEGFNDNYLADGQRLSSLAGGLAGQGLNLALGGDFTLSPFNFGFLHQSASGMGPLELRFGRDGFSAHFGLGGVDVSMGTLAAAARGTEAWKVNFDIWNSGSYEAKTYISQMRTLYSGGETSKDLYESILTGKTRVFENDRVDYTQTLYNENTGTKDIILGKNALSDESKFGLNVVLSHEAYRNGIDDGTEGQWQERNQAVAGHISTTLKMMQDYGEGAVSAAMAEEAKSYLESYQLLASSETSEQQKMEALTNLAGIFENYDAGGDFWRLVKRDDGKWGWMEDGSLDFNFDATDRQLYRAFMDAGGGIVTIRNGIGTVKNENMTSAFLARLGIGLGIEKSMPVLTNINTRRIKPAAPSIELTQFVNGTMSFVQASLATKVSMGELSQKNIAALNAALLNVQKTGLLVKSPLRYASGLNGQGTDTAPYLPLTGKVTVTCFDGYRFVTEDTFGGGSDPNYPLNDFAKYYHSGVDLISSAHNVVSSVSGSLQLNYSSVYGLNGTVISGTNALSFTSNHLAKETIMNYLNVFGMSGTTLRANDNGEYVLNGLRAGVTFGTMGKTGKSFGNHVDFIVKDLTGRMQGSVFQRIFTTGNYGNLSVHEWAQKYSGLPSKEWNDPIKEYMLDQYKKKMYPVVDLLMLSF